MKQIFLNFHGIGAPPPGTDVEERRYWWDEGLFFLALDNIAAAIPASDLAVRITFDDGNMSDAKIALPALVGRGLTASFFVCAGRIGRPNYLDAAAIRDLLSAGMTIGSHGMGHLDWRKLHDAALDTEISDARQVLGDICGREIDEVSIPFGSYDRRVLARVRLEDYRNAYTSDGGTVQGDRWLKPRNTLDRSWQTRNLLAELAARDSITRRMRRVLLNMYKGALVSQMVVCFAVV
jgi:peptidoglycan/xylan/chitin deacetylase (PgdA/CDA1 family)